MISFLITVISLFFTIKSFFTVPIPSWASDLSYLPLFFWKKSDTNPMEHRLSRKKPSVLEENGQASLLDLPELPLQCILERLTPTGLCNMAGVCSSLRERCTSDHFWKRHMDQKWGSVLSSAAIRKWKCSKESEKNSDPLKRPKVQDLISFIGQMWSFTGFSSEFDHAKVKQKSSLPEDSIMSWYLALETGKFWFPAQVYNRENGHVGFLLSCYDAELSYDSQTDTFKAKYLPHGKRAAAIENYIEWVRVRAAPVDTSPHELHVSNCLTDLRPGDHIEIQWRRNKEFPYGWWYGVVGHLESCDGNEYYCQCHENDMVALEFRQYAPGSRWRCFTVSRKDHQEVGDETDGFYGGIRKLYRRQEIAVWDRLWPEDALG